MSGSHSDINLLLQSRVEFFRRYRSERNTASFFENENRLISLITSERGAALLRSVSVSLSAPVLSSFYDPVTVAPTTQQINHAFLEPSPRPEGSCAICQENFDDASPIVRLRNCNHCFHRDCARTWYRISVYCPMCRNDIRT
jgi:hypothetical protein